MSVISTLTECSVKLVDVETGAIKHTLPAVGVLEIAFSSKGSYCQTWERTSTQSSLAIRLCGDSLT